MAFKLNLWIWMKFNRWKREEGLLDKSGTWPKSPERRTR